MILLLQRSKPRSPGYPVLGRLTAPGLDIRTLEDPYILNKYLSFSGMGNADKQDHRGIYWPYTSIKIPGVTAIPAGKYRIYNTYSPRFKKELPLIVDVPDYTGIRCHSGESAEHSAGCIVLGERILHDRALLGSLEAVGKLISFLDGLVDEAWIEIKNPMD